MTNEWSTIMMGLGGQGLLLAGRLLASAAMTDYKHVLWYPSYGAEKRGGICDCTIIASNNHIPTPVLYQAEALMVLSPMRLESGQDRLIDGGTLILESTGLNESTVREDIHLINVPAVRKAQEMGGGEGANFIILGAYIKHTRVLSPDIMKKEIEKRFTGNREMTERNMAAFQIGLTL